MRDTYARYGAVAAVSDHDASLVLAFGPDCNRQILSNPQLFHSAAELPIRIPEGSSLMRLSTFLAGMNGGQHDKLRRLMMPLFQKSYLETYRDAIVAAAEGELARWRTGETTDISRAMARLSLCVAFQCLFGLDVSGDARELADMGLRFTEGATSPALLLLPYDLPGTPYRSFLRLCDRLEAKLRELIHERRARPDGRHDALSLLVAVHDEDGTLLPDASLVGLANELFIAGHETTACTLAWTLFLLERHPKILGDVLDELASVLHGDAPTVEQIDRLPLLDAVVKESMRILPASPFFFFRRTTESVKVGSYELPAGASLVISPLMTHHMADLYPEPRRFKPERWNGEPPARYEYLPFGAGPRACLGASFAALSLRTMLALILQRFRLTLEPGARVSFKVRGIILGTKHGLPMRVERPSRTTAATAPLRGDIAELIDVS